MATVKVYNLKGEETGDLKLDDAVFGVEVKPALVQYVLRAQRANAHAPYAHTKDRSEKRGGGKKPWAQKGTGRARHGSSRSPIWRGGGVTFGPRSNRNMKKKINKKENRAAIRMVLSDKVSEKMLLVVDSFEGLEGKTKQLATMLAATPAQGRSILIASGEKNAALTRSVQNLPKTDSTMARSLNVTSLLKNQYLLVDKAGIEALTEQFK